MRIVVSTFLFVLLLHTGSTSTKLVAAEPSSPKTLRQAMARLDALEKTLSTKPNDPQARLAQGEIYIWLGTHTAALRALNPLTDDYPKLAGLSEAMARVGELPDTSFEQLIQSLTESADALIAGDAQHAADTFRISLLSLPDIGKPEFGVWTLHQIRGERLADKQRLDLARLDFNRAVGPDGRLTAEAHVALGRAFRDEENYPAALAELALVQPDAKQDYLFARYWIAQVHVLQHGKTKDVAELKTAVKIFDELIAADPSDEDYVKGRAAALALLPTEDRGRIPLEAKDELAQALALEQAGNTTEALRQIDGLLLRAPRLPEAYLARARLSADREQSALARAVAQELISVRPVVAAEAFPDDATLAPLHAAVHRRPYSSTPYIARARANLSKSSRARIEVALHDARRAIQLEPYDPQAHAVLAECLVARARSIDFKEFAARDQATTEAFVAADHALALAPEDFGLLLWRGDLSATYGANIAQRPGSAIRFYTRALRLDPSSVPARLARARASVEAGRKSDAIADYESILTIAPGYRIASDELARVRSGESDQLELDAKPTR